MGGPVYFTVGSNTSGWTIAISTAALTAIGGFVAAWALENYKRHRDRQAIASSLWAEIAVSLSATERAKEVLQGIVVSWEKIKADGTVWKDTAAMGSSQFTFPPMVYEKVADRVGVFGLEVGGSVVRFYGFLSSYQTTVQLALGPGELALGLRIGLLKALTEAIPAELQLGRKAMGLLDAQLKKSWLSVPALFSGLLSAER